MIALDVPANIAAIGELRIERAIFAIGERSPRLDQGVREDQFSIDAQLAEDRLILAGNTENSMRGSHRSLGHESADAGLEDHFAIDNDEFFIEKKLHGFAEDLPFKFEAFAFDVINAIDSDVDVEDIL